MGHVTARINGRTYRFNCEDGDEARFTAIAKCVSDTVEDLILEFGQVGEDRLLALAALRLADQLFDVRDELQKTVGASSSA